MAGTKKAEVGVAIFPYRDPKTKGLRYARKGDTVTLTEEDYDRLERGGGLASQQQQAAVEATITSYDQATVAEAILVLERTPEDQREQFFEHERARKRKGVLTHFEQPLWEGAEEEAVAEDDEGTDLSDYEPLNVEEAVTYLEKLAPSEREPYFAFEIKRGRKGVLTHFEQPTE